MKSIFPFLFCSIFTGCASDYIVDIENTDATKGGPRNMPDELARKYTVGDIMVWPDFFVEARDRYKLIIYAESNNGKETVVVDHVKIIIDEMVINYGIGVINQKSFPSWQYSRNTDNYWSSMTGEVIDNLNEQTAMGAERITVVINVTVFTADGIPKENQIEITFKAKKKTMRYIPGTPW